MLDRFKQDLEELMHNDNVDCFGYIIDKPNNTLVGVNKNQIDAINKNDLTQNTCYVLDEVLNDYNKQNNQIKALKKAIEIDKVVLACAQTLLEKNSFEDSINKLLGVLCDFYGGTFACLFERDYINNITSVNYKYHNQDVSLIDKKYTNSFKISAEDSWTKYLREHSFAFLQTHKDIDESLIDSSYYKRFMESKRKNLLVVSLNDNDLILGGIEIENITKNQEYVELIKTISAFIVNNLHIKNAHLDLQKNINDLENKNILNDTIFACTKTLVDDQNIEISMNNLLKIITEYYGASTTNIFYKQLTTEMVKCEYCYIDGSKSLEENQKKKNKSPVPLYDMEKLFNNFKLTETNTEEKSVGVGHISSVREMADMLEQSFPKSYEELVSNNINSLLFVPLTIKNKIVGFMVVENPKRNLNEAFLLITMSTFVVNYINKNELLNKLEKLSYTDSLTTLYNRNFYNNYLSEFKNNPNNSVGIIFADVNGLKKANDNFGHELGDKLIKWSANFFKKNADGLKFRIGGDEFVCIIENIEQDKFIKIVEEIKEKLNAYGEVHISIGKAWDNNSPNIEKVIVTADEDMYAEKKKYYQEMANDERSIKNALQEFKQSIENLEIN